MINKVLETITAANLCKNVAQKEMQVAPKKNKDNFFTLSV